YQQMLNGTYPVLIDSVPQISALIEQVGIDVDINEYHFWAVWSLVLAIFVWGAQRRLLWGGIGLVTLNIGCLVLFVASILQGSVAACAASNVALVAYALQGKYALIEVGRLHLPSALSTPRESAQDIPATLINQDFPFS